MDWLTFISADIKAVAWPTAVVVSLVFLRRDVGRLLQILGARLQNAKGPWGEFSFGQGIDDVESKLTPNKTKAIADEEDAKQIEDASDLVRLPPPYIVLQAWLRLEQAMRVAVDERLPNKPVSTGRRNLQPNAYLNLLTVLGILPHDEVDVLRELQTLRNRAAHSLDPEITITDALRYNDIVKSLISRIELSRKNLPRPDNSC